MYVFFESQKKNLMCVVLKENRICLSTLVEFHTLGVRVHASVIVGYETKLPVHHDY